MNCVLQTVEDSLSSERAERRGCFSALPMGEGLRRLGNCRGQFQPKTGEAPNGRCLAELGNKKAPHWRGLQSLVALKY